VNVIGAGFGRTGTRSLQAALELLGHRPCYHMSTVIAEPYRVRQWLDIGEGRGPGWYDSVSETIFARALAERRPLPLRRRVIRRLVARRAPDFALYPRMARATIFDRVFDGRIDDRAHAIEVYENHVADVKATIPPDRLLVFDVRQGWEPLCDFLGTPIPDEPFPESNERAAWHGKRPRRLLRLILRGR
jgi:hypothetical protein